MMIAPFVLFGWNPGFNNTQRILSVNILPRIKTMMMMMAHRCFLLGWLLLESMT